MKAKEIREMTPEEIERSLLECRKEIFNLRLQFQTGQLENSSRIRTLRKDVARLETEKSARRLAEDGVVRKSGMGRRARQEAERKLAVTAEHEARRQANLAKGSAK
ncbi:MAG: 50S ribosomal protein L29 [Lentisphaerae bacterium]|jgi:large subunit ribosomal protein L29|nr:50S ribosomal protein L29 [Lentisphaerota bacterium]